MAVCSRDAATTIASLLKDSFPQNHLMNLTCQMAENARPSCIQCTYNMHHHHHHHIMIMSYSVKVEKKAALISVGTKSGSVCTLHARTRVCLYVRLKEEGKNKQSRS